MNAFDTLMANAKNSDMGTPTHEHLVLSDELTIIQLTVLIAYSHKKIDARLKSFSVGAELSEVAAAQLLRISILLNGARNMPTERTELVMRSKILVVVIKLLDNLGRCVAIIRQPGLVLATP